MADVTMHSPATATSVPLTLIVALTRASHGIGRASGLPWPQLKPEMAYFTRVTRRVPSTLIDAHPTRKFQNAVIMGRKTWESIPRKFRPLKGRTNVVITRQQTLEGSEEDVMIASSIQDGVENLKSRFWTEEQDAKSEKTGLGRCFIIGGAEIYKAAVELDNTTSVLCTRVMEPDFECDVHFPIDLGQTQGWREESTEQLENFTGEAGLEGEKMQDDVKWKYELWNRVH